MQNVFVNAGYKDIFDWQGKPVLAEANGLAREVSNGRLETIYMNCVKLNGDVLFGSSHTAPDCVFPIFFPSEFKSSVIVIAPASSPNFLRISSVPASMLLH